MDYNLHELPKSFGGMSCGGLWRIYFVEDEMDPRFADGTLAPPLPQEASGFPRIPGVVYNGVHHTGDLWDFGPDLDKGVLSVLPPRLIGTPYPIFVPKADTGGNDIASGRLPEVGSASRNIYGLDVARRRPR
jgi:hypothetical protein